MKKILLDTDIGADCDDAVALGFLLRAELDGKCTVCGITTSTTRFGASSAVNAICNYYGVKKDVAVLKLTALACDAFDNYASDVAVKYGNVESTRDCVTFLRERLAMSDEKLIIAAIGPLTGIKRLLLSEPDDISPLNGVDLFNEKVESVYCMGGCFDGSLDGDGYGNREWNFVQDVDAVKVFLRYCETPIYFIPKETGEKVFTGSVLKNSKNNPVADCIRFFGEKHTESLAYKAFKRESWDPITCYLAVFDCGDLFKTRSGKVVIDDDGVTSFLPDESGRHFVVEIDADPLAVASAIDKFLI